MSSRKIKKVKGGSCNEHGPKGIDTDNSIQSGGSGVFASFFGKAKPSNGETAGAAAAGTTPLVKATESTKPPASVATPASAAAGTTPLVKAAGSEESKTEIENTNRRSDFSRSSFNDSQNGDGSNPTLKTLIGLDSNISEMTSESLKYIIHMLIRVCKNEIKNGVDPEIILEIIKNINATIAEQQTFDGKCDIDVINIELAKTKKELTDTKAQMSGLTSNTLVKTIAETLQKDGVYKNDPLRFSVTKKDKSFTITPI